jgi:hypothetical protein
MNHYDLFLTISTRAHASYTIQGCIRPTDALNGDERFHAAIRYTCISIHGYGRLGWGFTAGKDWVIFGGHNDEVDDSFFFSTSSRRPALVWCFYCRLFLFFSLGSGGFCGLHLCQSQRPVQEVCYAFLTLVSLYYLVLYSANLFLVLDFNIPLPSIGRTLCTYALQFLWYPFVF